MKSTSQTVQELPANLVALHQKLQEMAVRKKSSTTRPVAQGLVMVIKGK